VLGARGMKEGLRQAMAWLHTWVGLVFGWLLFAIFLTGTLSCFKDEINHWAQPEIVRHELNPIASLAVAERYLSEHAAGASRWFIGLPDERQPTLSLYWQIPGKPGRSGFVQQRLDALSGEPVQARDSRGGEFFLRFHYELQMGYPWGRWLASIAAMAMLVALVSGIITHKKIFREFFTFRPAKGQRSWLDGHNLIGVLVLPFHLMITYSSLVIFMSMTMPAGILVNYGNSMQAYYADLLPAGAPPPSLRQAAPLLPLTQLYQQAAQRWPDTRMGAVTVSNPGDASATVLFARDDADRVAYRPGDGIQFNGVDGRLLGDYQSNGVASTLAASFYGLHMGHFAGPWLRWLYFLAGLGSTAMIGTGLVMWLNKRRLKQARSSERRLELRLVEVLNLAGMGGLVLAVASFFLANRLLPLELAQRGDWEVRLFFLSWALSALHAGLRPVAQAWREQLGLAALLMFCAPLIGLLATPYGLWASLRAGDRMLAGVDLGLLASACLLFWGVRKLVAHASAKPPARAPRVAVVLDREVH
jgi:uncharacterized iron-regulated membrane protein